MKNTFKNRKLVADYFRDTDFKAGGNDEAPENTPYPFMLFGIGWGEMLLKCICIQFDSENMLPHICIEYSPCSSPSRYFYMELTEENIQKLPKTSREFYDVHFPKMGRMKKDYMKLKKSITK